MDNDVVDISNLHRQFGYDDKKMYVWIDAVLGYLTATMKYCEDNKLNWEDY